MGGDEGGQAGRELCNVETGAAGLEGVGFSTWALIASTTISLKFKNQINKLNH